MDQYLQFSKWQVCKKLFFSVIKPIEFCINSKMYWMMDGTFSLHEWWLVEEYFAVYIFLKFLLLITSNSVAKGSTCCRGDQAVCRHRCAACYSGTNCWQEMKVTELDYTLRHLAKGTRVLLKVLPSTRGILALHRMSALFMAEQRMRTPLL